MSTPFRFSICNEIYQKWDFAEACRSIKRIGWDGIELAHFTLADSPLDISPARRRELKDIMASEGLPFVGLHWVMVAPKGLHVTTPDAALREKSWEHIRHLVDLCADLGDGGILVFGSPKQRNITGGITREEATRNFVDGLAGVAPHAVARGATILIEALPSDQTDVILSLDESAELARQINSPGVATMFDVHNAVFETEPHSVLIRRHFPLIRHVHVNENDGRHPGEGDYDFTTLMRTLLELNYSRWVSLEAFDFTYPSEVIAADGLKHLKKALAEAQAA